MNTSIKMHRPLTRFNRTAAVRLFAIVLLLLGLAWPYTGQAQSYVLTNLWSLAPKTNTFLNNYNNLSRGLAYNPVSGHVLVVSRESVPDYGTNVFGTNGIYILNATNGALLGKLPYDPTLITNGTFYINMIGVTDDGVIYVGNLSVDAAAAPGATAGPFKLYRWANESSMPQLVYSGDPSGGATIGTSPRRFGDSLALRGAGTGTQILLGTYNYTVALLTTLDGVNFTAAKISTDMTASGNNGDSRWGIAWGAGNTFWVKQASGSLRRLSLSIPDSSATVITNAVVAGAGGPLDVDVNLNLMGLLDTTAHTLRLYDILDPSNPIQQDTTRSFPSSVANGNFVGAVALRNGNLFALESNNGILAFSLGQTSLPATITASPSSVTLWEGATYTVSANYGGTRPFSYQWRLGGTNIPGATGPTLPILNFSYDKAGAYSVTVSNLLGGAVSSSGTLTINAANASAQATRLWNLPPGTRPYLTCRPAGDSLSGYKEYGAAINPVNTNIIIATRLNPTNMLAVLDRNGNHLHYIDYSGLGVDQMNRVDVADDGMVYVCNIATSTGTAFKIFAFANDGPNPVLYQDKWIAFSGDPGNGQTVSTNGWGSTMSVRGGGQGTEILLGGLNAAVRTFAILKPDANFNFTSTVITVPGAPAGFCRLGIDFGPGTNTVWAKTAGGSLFLIQYDLSTGQGSVLNSYPLTMTLSPPAYRFVPSAYTEIKYDPATKLLAGPQNYGAGWGAPQQPVSVVLYDVADPDTGPFLVDQELFPTYNSDIEFQGTCDFANGYLLAMGLNNGLMMCQVNTNFGSIPRILSQPVSTVSYVGTVASFSVFADTVPLGLTYQWYRDGNAVTTGTDATLSLTNLQTGDAGVYTVSVSNANGFRMSAPATLTVLVPATTAQMTNIWSLAAGDRTYLNTTYSEYGMAYNPVTSNLLVVSLAGAPTIAVLDALTGADKHTLDLSVVSGGSKVLHKIDVADDGVVYAGNSTTTAGPTNPLKIYRWENDGSNTVATVAFSGDPGLPAVTNKACGYTFDVRGAGTNTEILVGMGAWGALANTVAILKTTDGMNFTARSILVSAAPAGFSRLGLCFGPGNTFWAKAWRDEAVALGKLYLVQYDLTAGTGTILKTYDTTQVSSTVTSLAYNDNLKLLAGLAYDNQESVMMYDVSNLILGPQLRDQELFPTYNASIEANGDVDYGGDTLLFALCENNGIMAFRINAKYGHFRILNVAPAGGAVALTWEAVSTAKYQVQRAVAPGGPWTDLGTAITATADTASYTDTTPDPAMRFYRVIGK